MKRWQLDEVGQRLTQPAAVHAVTASRNTEVLQEIKL